jgi:hypothetical protein
MLDIMEISKIHNRAPGGIISRLCKNNTIPNRMSARGYGDYKNSDMYKEIVSNSEERRKKMKIEKKEKTVKSKLLDNILISINKSDYIELQNDVKEMKHEITNLRSTIKELVEMMKAVYEFEDV